MLGGLSGRRLPRISPAAAVGAVAIAVALSGTALAVKNNSVGTRAIADDSVRSRDIENQGVRPVDLADDAVRPEDILDDALTGSDVLESSIEHGWRLTTGPRGEDGPVGPDGPAGLTGLQGPAFQAGSAPNGPAGGDLSGSYPNPSLATGSIASTEILNGQVNADDLSSGLIDALATAPSRRTLGGNPQQAAPGDDPRLSNARIPTPDSVRATKVLNGSLRLADVAKFTQTVATAGGSVAAGTCSVLDDSSAPYDAGDLVVVLPPPGTPAGLVAQNYQAIDDERLVRVCNLTAGPLSLPAGAVRLLALKP